mgnify:CR=1 FL=1
MKEKINKKVILIFSFFGIFFFAFMAHLVNVQVINAEKYSATSHSFSGASRLKFGDIHPGQLLGQPFTQTAILFPGPSAVIPVKVLSICIGD